ncbi:hypothetical protein B0J14DRAFT_654215 [Halenospora varia]|nr:hypothetical protein B0J14DRAFT_654215 [Halenospora varia]
MKVVVLVTVIFAATVSMAMPIQPGLNNIAPAIFDVVPKAVEIAATSGNATNAVSKDTPVVLAKNIEIRTTEKKWGGCNGVIDGAILMGI